jgi:hypothetical protein
MAQPLAPVPIFPSILCGADNGTAGTAARRQAAWLAETDAALEIVAARELTRLGPELLGRRCVPYDLLVLPSAPETHLLAARAGIPVLLAGWCPEGKDVTDDMLVAVSDRPGAMRATRLAALIAGRHRGSVSIVAAPHRSQELDRAIAASSRIILSTAGAVPRLLGAIDSPERAVAKAIAAVGASLLVLGVDPLSPAPVADLARFAGCSVLAVPAPVVTGGRFMPSESAAVAVRRPEPARV